MRIGLISEYYYPDNLGSTGTVLSNLTRYLRDTYPEIEIDVITSKHLYRGGDGKLPAYEEWDGIRIYRVNAPKTKRASMLLRLLAGAIFSVVVLMRLLLHRPSYDLLLVVTNPPNLPEVGYLYYLLRKVPYIYLVHDLHPDVPVKLGVLSPRSIPVRIASWLQQRWLRHAARVVVLGRCMKAYITRTYAVPESRVEVITNWADPQQIVPLNGTTRFRRQHDINGFTVLYAGNLGEFQRFDEILAAAQALRDTYPDITFLFVGEGAKKSYLEHQVQARQLTNVRFFPYVPQKDLADLLASANVSLITLEPGMEGLGVPSKLYNILASGRPTIGLVDVSSEVAQVLDEAKCGLHINHGDGQELAKAILTLYQSPEMCLQMGQNARHVLQQQYTLPLIAEQFMRMFNEIIESHARHE